MRNGEWENWSLKMGERVKRRGDDLSRRLIEFAAQIGEVVDSLPDK
jgi:hypothetical protein